ncbi:MAG TPA: protoporphyrinogen oxidase [Acidimicrobiales bacterium]|nr:protoporphyrinogen oxidase [Acidimicrobiales bacterium]
MSTRRSVVVVGGGVAGLAAARLLARHADVVLLERESRVGGKLTTVEFRGRPLDVGPDNFITRNDAAERLCRELGLGDDLLAPATSSAAVYSRGRPRRLPAGLVLGVPTDLGALRRSGIVGAGAAFRAALDLVLPRSAVSAALADVADDPRAGDVGAADGPDPTVHEVLVPRLGRSVVAALVDPLLGGINAGDCSTLSLRAAAPQLASAAAEGRSILRALRARASARPAGGEPTGASRSPLFLGLTGGIETLVSRLAEECERRGASLRAASPVTGLELRPGEERGPWLVRCGSEALHADGVVLALPAQGASHLLAPVAPDLARECGSIAYSGVVTVTLAWDAGSVPPALASRIGPRSSRRSGDGSSVGSSAVLPGSGVLVPRAVGGIVTAATFTSTKWPRSAGPGEVVVRVSAGRDGDERALALGDGELVAAVRAELASLLGIVATPLDSLVWRWPASFPQYTSGHLARAARIAGLAEALPGLALAGAAYDGIGIPACVASGERAAAILGGRLGG